MARSLSDLADNLSERIHKINSNMDMIIKTPKRMKLNTKIVSAIYITQTIKII